MKTEPLSPQNYPFICVFPWSGTTFKVVGEVGNTECTHEQLKAILEAWIAKHLTP